MTLNYRVCHGIDFNDLGYREQENAMNKIKMMQDVKAWNRGPFHKISVAYSSMSHCMNIYDSDTNPLLYCDDTFTSLLKNGKYGFLYKNEPNCTRLRLEARC